MVSFNGQTLPQDPDRGCCHWRGGTIALGATDYKASFVITNKALTAVSMGAVASDPDGRSLVEEEGEFALDGTTITLSRDFSTLPIMALTNLRLEGDEIFATLTVDPRTRQSESHEVVFRR